MTKLEKWTGEKTYMYPNGELAIPQRINADFPAALTFPHLIGTDEGGEVLYSIQNLSSLRTTYEIDKSLTEDEAIKEIESKMNEPQVQEPTAEERIASAMEFNNITMLANMQGGE